jgi:replicative DNA helicase
MTDSLYNVVTQEQVEAEKMVIGTVIRTPDALSNIGYLDQNDFMVPAHQEFWNRVKNGEDSLTVASEIPGMTKAFTWSNEAMYGRAGEYADALQNKAYIREAVGAAEGIIKAAMEGDRDAIQALAIDMAGRQSGGYSGMRTPMDIATSLNTRIDAGNLSVPWGIASMDTSTRGSERGTLTVLAARPSMGKSSLAFQCNEYQATELALKVGVWALEMSGEQMYARRTCHKVDAMWMDVRSENITAVQKENLKKHVIGYAEWLDNRLLVNDDTSTTVAQIVRTQLRERFDVLMIDHLGLLKDKKFRGERHDQYLGRLTETLHALAKDTHCVIMLLCQLNRGVENRTDKRPHMGDLRDSGQIEQNADNVALLYGEWYYNRGADNVTEVIWGKYRDGVKDSLSLVEFDMANQRFISVAKQEFDEYVERQMEDAQNGQAQLFSEPDDIPF